MLKQKWVLNVYRAIFPATITGMAFVCFLAVNWFLMQTSVEPVYEKGLPFAVPFLCLGAVTLLTALGYLRTAPAVGITILLAFFLAAGSICYLFWLSLEAATITTTDPGRYEKALSVLHASTRPGLEQFPEAIPQEAENAQFLYHPAMLQGGELICLQFQADSEAIEDYGRKFAKQSRWSGAPAQCESVPGDLLQRRIQVFDGGKQNRTAGWTLYLFYGQPSRPADWNHGEVGFAAVHEEENKILFCYEDW